MKDQPSNPPAYPLPEYREFSRSERNEGMTLRDYFAAAALQGYFSAPNTPHMNAADEHVAKYCYDMADAMLKVREL